MCPTTGLDFVIDVKPTESIYFSEFEPSYNWRVDEPYDQRAGAWKVELRFEFLLFDDLRRDKD